MTSIRTMFLLGLTLSLGLSVEAKGEPEEIIKIPKARAGSVNPPTARVGNVYPTESIAADEEGVVGFTVTVTKDGRAKDCKVTSSSGFPRLDKAACEGVEKHARFSPARDNYGQRKEGKFSSKIVFQLSKNKGPADSTD